jgi:hypothetical protein
MSNEKRPAYFPCEHCGKEDHSGWGPDTKSKAIMYLVYCSEECHTKSNEEEVAWLDEIKNRSSGDFPEEVDERAYNEMAIWVANKMLQDPAKKKKMTDTHGLYGFPEVLANHIRPYALDELKKLCPELVSTTHMTGWYEFNGPVPREMALKSFA